MKDSSPASKEHLNDTDFTHKTFTKWLITAHGEAHLTSVPTDALLSNGYKCYKYAQAHKGHSLYVYYSTKDTTFNAWWHKHVQNGDLRRGCVCGDVVIAYGYDNVDEDLRAIAQSLNFCAN